MIETAIRETREEIGTVHSRENIFELGKVYIPPSNFLVTPYVKIEYSPLRFEVDSFEVKSVIEVPVQYLVDEKLSTKSFEVLSSIKQYNTQVPVFDFNFVFGLGKSFNDST